MAYRTNPEYKLFINSTFIGTGTFIDIFKGKDKDIEFCYDGGDGPEIVLELRKKFVEIDEKNKIIRFKIGNDQNSKCPDCGKSKLITLTCEDDACGFDRQAAPKEILKCNECSAKECGI